MTTRSDWLREELYAPQNRRFGFKYFARKMARKSSGIKTWAGYCLVQVYCLSCILSLLFDLTCRVIVAHWLGIAIAGMLDLLNPEFYTSHCFRRTAATLMADSG